MQLNRKRVEKALKKKGFRLTGSGHRYFQYWTIDERKTTIKTYTSHSGKELQDYHIKHMAWQCRISKEDFLSLVECPISREEYEALLSTHKEL